MRSAQPDNRLAQGFALVLSALLFACVANHPPTAADSVIGSARDADTDEAIAGAWIFETRRKPGSVADVLHVERARRTRSDASGQFRFEAESIRFSLGRRYPPRYHFYHPSYGLLRARAERDGLTVLFRSSLREAHLRQLDARIFCSSPTRDSMAKKMVELACPPAHPDRFPNGSPRAPGTWTNGVVATAHGSSFVRMEA